ncbi:peptide/nickel transport system permease protein [Pullulanibacillus pueri]|uniref:Peptide ABC transporter permease n=1 Tax=Pullulanibacillus pueri TaxID=1437324 RepID=A0A8J3EMT3_9BACL|nr:ABC transporter permease [Pullulanibacillus pueri]MBM7682869.1 peptide/nickel transport system permease protein [Pullulanibacillus pueri]GGH84338.1 peptide ABC transporter permease [Pullulanibacillus pueri]
MNQTRKKKNMNLLIGTIILLFFLCLMVISFFYTPYDVSKIQVSDKLQSPSLAHWLGTDKFGRDTLSRIMKSTQTAFFVGAVVVVIGLVIGTLIGGIAGYIGGWIDDIIMRFIDAMMAFPGIILAIMIVAVFGTGIINTSLALGILTVPSIARIARSGFIQNKALDYVVAAKAVGVHPMKIVFQEILPNVYSQLLVAGSIAFAGALLAESALSYLGLGVQPPDPSLGQMLNEAQEYLTDDPWYALAPGVTLSLLILGFYMLSNGLREVLDHRLS